MTQIEYSLKSLPFEETGTETTWERYGILQHFGSFAGQPKRYQVVSIKTEKGTQNIVKSPFFIPVPTAVAQEITRYVADQLTMKIKDEYNDGIRYMATLISPQIKGEIEPGDIVAWGIGVRSSVVGSFRTDISLLRLVCSNGMMEPVESEIANVEKSYDIEAMKESFLANAKLLQETFEEKLRMFRDFTNYKMNQEFAQILARTFPKPIIQDIITVGEKKTVIEFKPVTLRRAYDAITYQISNRALKLTTKYDWLLKTTMRFKEYIAEQEVQTS